MYVYDLESDTFIPYKADYSASVPVSDFEFARKQMTKKSREPIRNNELGIIVPLIHAQPRQSDWAQLASIAQRYPRVNTIAVVSPSQDTRGIVDFGPDPEFNNMVRFLQNSSVQVVGYVDLSTSKISDQIDSVKTEIDRWREWYPSVNGIYFDNVSIDTNGYDKCRRLSLYAKVDKNFQSTVVNLANTKPGGVVNWNDDFCREMDTVDTFIIYERGDYPADGWYPSIKKEWMAKHPRSRFAFFVTGAGSETLACRNFVDKCVGIEKAAGYVYVNNVTGDNLASWKNLSPLTEIAIEALSSLAQQEGISISKGGGVPQNTMIDTSAGLEGREVSAKASNSQDENPEIISRSAMDLDKFGVRMIYPNAKGTKTNEWYLFEDNPRADTNFKNLPDRLTREPDGSWSSDDNQVRLEAWSPKNRKFLNVEISGYFRGLKMPPKGNNYLVQQYARGGHHYSDIAKWCEGSAYKGRLLVNGNVTAVKEIHHNAYTSNRGTTQATTKDLKNRWIGMKTVVYNYTKRDAKTKKDKTCVGIEIWIDDNVNDSEGNLVVRNDWKLAMKMIDEGGWFASADYSTKTKKGFRKDKCSKLNVDSTKKYRQKDEILNMSGGTSDKNCIAYRWDQSKIAFKHLSVREIERVSPD